MNEQRRTASLPYALMCFVLVGLTGYFAGQFRPGPWYEGLDKVPWNPPGWLFAPVWTVLYVAIAVAGWKIFTQVRTATSRALWLGQLVVNALWSWLFFGLNLALAALLDISLLLLLVLLLLGHLYSRHRLSFWLLVPYALWGAFALSLNAGIVVLN